MLMNNGVGLGVIGMFLHDGVTIDKFDKSAQTIFISIPEDSYAYHDKHNDIIHDAESYAKRNKEVLSDLMHLPNLKLKFKTYPGYWTKEQGELNFKNNINQYM